MVLCTMCFNTISSLYLLMAANQGVLNSILMVCGIADQAQCDHIFNNESFTSLEDFCMFKSNKDVDHMVSHLVARAQQEGCVHLRTIVIKKLQALVFWCKDHQIHGVDLVAADFNQAALMEAMENKHVQKEAKEM